MSQSITLGNRVEISPTTGGLFVGDVLAIMVFVVAGRIRHASVLDPVGVLAAAAPFLIGWVLAAAFFGLFASAMLRTVRETAVRTGGAWIVGALLGQGLRATAVFPGGFDVAFVVVSLVVGGVLLVLWRIAYVRFLR